MLGRWALLGMMSGMLWAGPSALQPVPKAKPRKEEPSKPLLDKEAPKDQERLTKEIRKKRQRIKRREAVTPK